jgi:hypothetical protein
VLLALAAEAGFDTVYLQFGQKATRKALNCNGEALETLQSLVPDVEFVPFDGTEEQSRQHTRVTIGFLETDHSSTGLVQSPNTLNAHNKASCSVLTGIVPVI